MQNKQKVMIVDDDDIDVEAICRLIKKNDIAVDVEIACDGYEAIGKLKGLYGYIKIPTPNILFLDINMPRVSGLEVLKFIREDPELENLRIYILSTSELPEEMRQVKQFNVSDHFTKPICKQLFLKLFSPTPSAE